MSFMNIEMDLNALQGLSEALAAPAKRRRYNEAFKRHVVGLLEEGKRSLQGLAEETGLSKGTLDQWKRRYGKREMGPARRKGERIPAPLAPAPSTSFVPEPPEPQPEANKVQNEPCIRISTPPPASINKPAKSTIFSSFPEVSVPLTVELQGEKVVVDSWNVAGVRWPASAPVLNQGEFYPVALAIGEGPIRLDLSCTAQAVMTEKGEPALLFADLSPEQAELLHRVVDERIAEEANGLLRLLEKNGAKELRRDSQARRHWRTFWVLAVVFALLGLTSWLWYLNVVTINPRYAVVSAPSTVVSTVVAGRLESALPAAGQRVEAGDLLGRVISPEVTNRIATIDHEVLALRGAMAQDESRLQEIAALSSAMADYNTESQETLRERMALTEERLSLDKTQADRLANVSGAVSTRAREEQVLKVIEAKAELEKLRHEMADTSFRTTLLSQGLTGLDGLRDNTSTARVLQARVEAAQAQLTRLARERSELEARLEVRAPAAGVVHRTLVREGETVEAHGPLVILVEDRAAFVQTLVLVEDARVLRAGDTGRFELADGRTMTGKVSEVSYETRPVGRAGLPERIFSEERYARVDLAVAEVDAGDVGMVAQARLQSRRISSFFGWELLR